MTRRTLPPVSRLLLLSTGFLALTACGGGGSQSTDGATDGADDDKGGTIAIDGSSTVFPINEAVAEEFQQGRKTRVTIGVSGTGGGMKKFCNGETDITGASRPIKPTEVEACKAKGIEWIELPIAYDGIAVVVHPDASWIDDITVEELKKIWEPEAQGEITQWAQVRDGWPAEKLNLYGAGVDSGTYDYFTKAVVGTEHSSRGDFTSSEDDNVLVQGISTDDHAMGFFGLAYYEENAEKLKLVPVDDGDDSNGAGPIAPSVQTVADGTYQPLSRPIFVYVAKKSADRPEISAFIDFYLSPEARPLVKEVGYIPLSDDAYGLVQQRFAKRTTGSLFDGKGSTVGATVEDLLGDKPAPAEEAAPAGEEAAPADEAAPAAEGAE